MLWLRTFCTMSIYDPNNQDVSKCVDFHCQNVLSRKNTISSVIWWQLTQYFWKYCSLKNEGMRRNELLMRFILHAGHAMCAIETPITEYSSNTQWLSTLLWKQCIVLYRLMDIKRHMPRFHETGIILAASLSTSLSEAPGRRMCLAVITWERTLFGSNGCFT